MDKYNDNNFPIEGSNTGALYQEPKAEDYRAGGVSKIIYKARTNGNWKPFRVTDEQQIGLYFDTNSCTDFGYANSVEEQVTYLIDTKQLAGNALTWFQDNGYFDENGKFNISDRFNAILAGTTAEGNYINNPWEASRQYGMLPEKDLPSRLKELRRWVSLILDTGELKISPSSSWRVVAIPNCSKMWRWIWTLSNLPSTRQSNCFCNSFKRLT